MAVPGEPTPLQWYADRCEDIEISRVSHRLALLHTIEAAYRAADSRIRLEQTIAQMRSGAARRDRREV